MRLHLALGRELRLFAIQVEAHNQPEGCPWEVLPLHPLDDRAHIIASVDLAPDPAGADAAEIPNLHASSADNRHGHRVVRIVGLSDEIDKFTRLAYR